MNASTPAPQTALPFDPRSSALVLVDLQNALAGLQLAPHPFAEVVARSAQLARALRHLGGTIVFVRVDINDRPDRLTDEAPRLPKGHPFPASASEIVAEAGFQPGDLLVTKRSWGAFHHTELDAKLRARGIQTLLMGGVATNIGVESTARSAMDLGYELILVHDAMSTGSAEEHAFALQHIFPRMGRVRSTEQLLAALAP